MDAKNLEKIIGYEFAEKEKLEEALTHRSYLNENPKWNRPHNERLEFLGDAVLELLVTESLYTTYPEEQEGKLTSVRAALVNYQMLAEVAQGINLGDFMYLSRGEAKDVGRARAVILANAMEALIGAVYLDGGMKAAKDLVERLVMPHLDEVMEKELYKDPKSLLQEITQERYKMTPRYEVTDELGPDHDKVFRVGVWVGEEKWGEGAGPSKQEAETEAADRALARVRENKN